MNLGRSMSSTLLHSPIMLTMKTIDAVTTVTLLAMLKITRPYTGKVHVGQALTYVYFAMKRNID